MVGLALDVTVTVTRYVGVTTGSRSGSVRATSDGV